MMWLMLPIILVFARHADCGALRCPEGTTCTAEEESKEKSPEELPSGVTCAPGSTWIDECNSCFCSDIGITYCSRVGCDSGKPPKLCAANTAWNKECNTCNCSDDGQPICTTTDCTAIKEKRSVELPSGEDCAPGTSWMNQCNSCSCGPTGIGYCTLMGCIGRESEPWTLCAENTSWKKGCNICNCKNGKPVCTERKCSTHKEKRSVELPEGEDCAPGTAWMNQCNRCACGPGGAGYCTLMGCPGRESEPWRHCAENSSWKKGCNICHCKDGKPVCTEKACSNHIEKRLVDLPTGEDCAPGSTWKNQCNSCSCSPTGYGMCTLRGCSSHNTEPRRLCAENTSWKNKCNTCTCHDGKPDCTKMECDSQKDTDALKIDHWQNDEVPRPGTQSSLSRKIRAVQEGPKQCQPGQEFRLDCNKCLCDNEGQNFSCTRMDCNALNNHNGDSYSSSRTKRETEKEQVKCVPGSVFDRGCNVCRCSDEGQHAICTMKKCRPNKEEGKPAEQDQGFRCNPGEQFAQECNDCTCSADGRSVFCTLRLCDKDISADI